MPHETIVRRHTSHPKCGHLRVKQPGGFWGRTHEICKNDMSRIESMERMRRNAIDPIVRQIVNVNLCFYIVAKDKQHQHDRCFFHRFQNGRLYSPAKIGNKTEYACLCLYFLT